MRHLISLKPLAAIALIIALPWLHPAHAKKPTVPPGGGGGTEYTIIPFRPPDATSLSSNVVDINEQHEAVGFTENADGVNEAIHLDVISEEYTTLSGGTVAGGINNLGQIVGTDDLTGLYWSSPTAAPIELPPLAGDLTSWAHRINDDGIIIGNSNDGEFNVTVAWRVFLDQNGVQQVDGPVPFPVFFPPDNSAADLNEVMQGSAQVLITTSVQAVIWTLAINGNGTLADPASPVFIDTLGIQNPSWAIGSGLNNLGDACGFSDSLPFVVLSGETPSALSTPRAALYAQALSINDVGQVVGYAGEKFKGIGYPGTFFAYLWQDGDRISLTEQLSGNSGWDRISVANVISNDGLIGGRGKADVRVRGFVMIPPKQSNED